MRSQFAADPSRNIFTHNIGISFDYDNETLSWEIMPRILPLWNVRWGNVINNINYVINEIRILKQKSDEIQIENVVNFIVSVRPIVLTDRFVLGSSSEH